MLVHALGIDGVLEEDGSECLDVDLEEVLRQRVDCVQELLELPEAESVFQVVYLDVLRMCVVNDTIRVLL